MKDAFERRALLLHLGDALHAISAALADHAKHHTLHHLLNAHPELAAHAWLAAMPPKMKTADFAARASASFAAWPALLLEEQVDYSALALAVHDNLFAEDRSGWPAYIGAIKPEVEWFGDALPFTGEPSPVVEPVQAKDEIEPPAARADAQGVSAQEASQRDSAEDNARLYPSWPWKPGV
ncbi:hypothetical protein [Paraburkholderia sp. C35]|uniref:hypothetical protein n=1 Tax=Paraburkholderia sp. C35 TaxID=2126993 RepID=UPI000D693D80|nr:hypothetical protein [Paraburkholderia sp. C35]